MGRLFRNIFYNYIGFFWVSLLGIVITPFIVRILGNEQYGIWAVALSLFGFANYLELGVSSALVLYVAECVTRHKDDDTMTVINSALTVYLILGIIVGLSLLALIPLLVNSFLQVSPNLKSLTSSILVIYAFLFIFQMPARIFEHALIGMQRMDVTNRLSIFFRTLERLSVLALLFMGAGLKVIVCVNGMMGLLQSLSGFFFLKRLIPEYRIKFLIRSEELKKLFTTGIQQFLGEIGVALIGFINVFLIASLVHVKEVVFFELGSRISQFLYLFSARLFMPIYPASTTFFVKGELEKLQKLFLYGTRIVIIFTLPIAFAVFLWSKGIIDLWMGPGYEAAGGVLKVLIFNYFLWSINVVPSAMMYGVHKSTLIASESLSRAGLNFLLGLLFVPSFGVMGSAYALMSASLITFLLFMVMKVRVFKIRFLLFVREVYLLPLVFFVFGLIAYLLIRPKGLSQYYFLGLLIFLFVGTSFLFSLRKGEVRILSRLF